MTSSPRTRPDASAAGGTARLAAPWLALLAAPAALGISGPAIVLPHIAAGMDVAADTATWLVTTNGLGIAVGTPLAAALISRRGIRSAVLICALVLLAATLVVAWGPNLPVTVVGRLAQALGGTGLIAAAMNMAGTALRMGLITASIAGFAALGPLVGSLVNGWLSWQPVLLLPVIALLAVPAAVRRAPRGAAAGAEAFDALGAGLLVALATALVFIPYFPLSAAAASLVLAVLLGLHVRSRPQGFVPVALLRSPVFVACSGLALVLGTSYFALLYLVPQLLAAGPGWSEDAVGVGTLVAQVLGSALSMGLAAVAARMGRPRVVAVLIVLGILGPVLAPAPWAVVVLAALAAAIFAAAGGQATLMVFATESLEEDGKPVAIGLFNLSYQLGGALGPALGALFATW